MADIGGRLIADGVVEPSQVAEARDRQRREGGYLGQHLIDGGHLSSSDFWAAVVRQWQEEARDLEQDSPQADLLADLDVEETIELGWIGCETLADTVVIATCVRPAEELVVEVQEHFPGRTVEFVRCTQQDLDAVAMAVRRQRGAGGVRTRARAIVRPAHHAMAGGIVALATASACVVPLALLGVALLLAVLAFVAGASVSAIAGAPMLASELRGQHRAGPRLPAVPGEPFHGLAPADQDLPVYTAIVRLRGGETAVRALVANFSGIDYPWARTDAILLVADSDLETLDALRRTTRRTWARVVRVPDDDFADVVRACDHGLALARGRYVVAWEQDERPERDQVRKAVAAFEADLDRRIDRGDTRPPLLGLRVAHRTGSTATAFGRLSAADEVLHLDRAAGAATASGRPPDITSVHCNMRLLRRGGGFASVVWRPTGERPADGADLRIEELDSTSLRAAVPGPLLWSRDRAEVFALVLLDARAQVAAIVRLGHNRRRDPARVLVLVEGVGTSVMFLAYPVVVLGTLVAAVRGGGLDGDLADAMTVFGLGAAVLVLAVAVGASWVVLTRRRGWWAGFAALAVPAHWLLHALAAWSALVAVLLQPARRRASPNLSP